MGLVSRKVASSVFTLSMAVWAAATLSACEQAPHAANQSLESDAYNIIGGTDATGAEDFAKHTVILFDTKNSTLCTASILSNSILVTAAHCVESNPSVLRVVFGTDIHAPDIIVRAVDSHQVSPVWKFREGMLLNKGDIAVVRFTGGLPTGYTPTQFISNTSKLTNDMDVMLAGFGASHTVRVRDPQSGELVSKRSGSGKLRSVTTTMKNVNYSKSEFLLESSKGKSACHGDSGGPAYVKIEVERNGQTVLEDVLIGVTSRGVDDVDDLCNVAAAYTSMAFYSTWIVSTAKALDAAALAAETTTIAAH